MVKRLKSQFKKRPLVFDGAMGTMIQELHLSPGAFGGYPGCNLILNVTSPNVISSIHESYLEAGADIITTNAFAPGVVLEEEGLSSRASELYRAAVKVARKAATKYSTVDKPRFVAGEAGPTSKLPTLGHIGFDKLFESYEAQFDVMVEEGVDCLLIATSQDILQAKAAVSAARHVLTRRGIDLPIFASVTMEKNGKMLLGSDILAALAALEPFKLSAFGINCATGPDLMEEQLRVLSKNSPFSILCRPNAGTPENVDGKTVYNLSPEKFAGTLAKYVKEFGISFVGGCCGTTPEYIRALAEKLQKSSEFGVRSSETKKVTSVSSLFSAVSLAQEPRPFIIAEQTNANGSKHFRELLLADDYDSMAAVGKKAALGAHALDICVAYAGRDEKKDMCEVVSRLVKTVNIPLMMDSTNPDVTQAALSITPGRSIINSINLEDGGIKAKRILELAKKYGALVVCLTIDEKGMAKTAKEKVNIAKRLIDFALQNGVRREDLLFDLLTFTIASGDASLRDAAIQTLEGIKLLKKMDVKTVLGVSNISYGLSVSARKVVNSLFLDETLRAGLDAAIINPVRILRSAKINDKERELARRLIYNDNSQGDPLKELVSYFYEIDSKDKGIEKKIDNLKLNPAEILRSKVIDGDKSELSSVLGAVLKTHGAADIINKVLLPAMKEVGQLMADGKLPLPFVLQSAEVMSHAVDLLSPKLAKGEVKKRGTIVLATVRGDVHDIGKNLVDIILSSNGFEVVNLGIKQPGSEILKAAKERDATAIGLSGLLVSSVEIMREDLQMMKCAGVNIPVLVGGAALTKKTTETVLQSVYSGDVYYCEDAFAGLKAMEKITG